MTKRIERSISAADLMAQLNADPEFVAKRARAEHERLERVAEWRRAEAPLVAELRAAGVTVESAWDLVNTRSPYPSALPILLDHVRRAIRRASEKESREPWPCQRRSSAGAR